MSVKEKMTAIADTIRSHTGGTEKLSLDDMPLEIENACTAEYEKGLADGQASGGYAEGVEAGKQAEQERFWDNYLNHESRYSYSYLFAGNGWNDDTFCPPEGTVITFAGVVNKNADSMFIASKITDLQRICRERNITLDFSEATRFSQFLADSAITTFPVLDTRGATNLNNILYAPQRLVTLEKLILKEDGSQTFNGNSFLLCGALENIIVEGKFGVSVDMHWSTKLTKASIESIMEALSLTATGQTLTLSKTAVDNAFHDPEGEDVIGSASADWNSLMESKPNWTITLV